MGCDLLLNQEVKANDGKQKCLKFENDYWNVDASRGGQTFSQQGPLGPWECRRGGHMQEVGKGVEEVWGLLVAHSVLSKRSSVSLRSCNNFLFQNKKKRKWLLSTVRTVQVFLCLLILFWSLTNSLNLVLIFTWCDKYYAPDVNRLCLSYFSIFFPGKNRKLHPLLLRNPSMFIQPFVTSQRTLEPPQELHPTSESCVFFQTSCSKRL